MRKEYGTALKTGSVRLLKERAPEFRQVRIKSQYVFPGDRKYGIPYLRERAATTA